MDASDRRGWWRLVGVATLWLTILLTTVGQWLLLALADPEGELARQIMPFDAVGPLFALVLASFGAAVVLRGDTQVYGWLMLATGFSLGVVDFTGAYSVYAMESAVPLGAAAAWVQDLWLVAWFLALLLLPSLFPDGKVASSRWRIPVRLASSVWVILILGFALAERNVSNWLTEIEDPVANATGFFAIPEVAYESTWVLIAIASAVIGIGSLITRWRHADFEMRQQLKWALLAFGLLLCLVALDVVNQALEAEGIDFGLDRVLRTVIALATIGLAVALGFAVLKFRLYDVDLVVNRTIVYGILTILVVVIYAALVAVLGTMLPIQEPALALVATGLVAVAFAPVRQRLQRGVNHMMFGQRDDPHAVLTEMGRRISETGSPEETLQTLCEVVATSLKLPAVGVDLEQEGEWARRATFGDEAASDFDRVTVPLRHQGEEIGRLVVTQRSSREQLTSRDRAVLEDVAHAAGAVANSVRLTAALQSSRWRLVLAREEERRRIRRDLHDGLGPSLASHTFQLDEVLDRLDDDPAAAADLVLALKEQNQRLVADVRRLVYELRPPTLDELGVAGALAAHVSQLQRFGGLAIEVETMPDPLPDLPAAVEVAAYRIAREAITNTVLHAHAGRCKATLHVSESSLIIEVDDDGVGLRGDSGPGVGITSMRERTEELGGDFSIAASRPVGTKVVATLPLVNGALAQRAHHG